MEKSLKSILKYHEMTAHVRGRLTGRTLNPAAMPRPFKSYRTIQSFQLPDTFRFPDVPLARALDARAVELDPRDALGNICALAAGISRARRYSDGTVFHFRATPSAGALYPTELYVALQNVIGMSDGLYHYMPFEHTLTLLRDGKVFEHAGGKPVIRFYLTSIFQRSCWKYGERAYRYCLLDAGHMADNALLGARMHGFEARVEYDFNDARVNRFLGVDPLYEGCLAQVHVAGSVKELGDQELAPLTDTTIFDMSREASVVSPSETVLDAHAATSSFARCPARGVGASLEEASPLPDPIVPDQTADIMMARRSRRNFVARNVKRRDLVDVVAMICHDVPPPTAGAVQPGFLAAPQSGMEAGFHRINRSNCSTTLVKPGTFMTQAALACLDQNWIENAAMHFVFTADLPALEQTCGPRSYRYATLEAGRLGQRVYLAATGKGLGVCGIGAFFDREASSLLSLRQGGEMLYLVAVGPVKE